MSKRKRKRKSGHPAPSKPAATHEDAAAIAAQISLVGADAAGGLWGDLNKTLLAAGAPASDVAQTVMHRDLDALELLLARLRGDAPEPEPTEPQGPIADVDPEVKKAAMKAFRRRVKFMKLDRESKLGVGPLTTGRKADFDSTTAPHGYPPEVWDALVADGQLIYDGDGFYRAKE